MLQRMDCKASPNPTTMYVEGCLSKVIDFLREDAVYVGTAAVIIALIMVIVTNITVFGDLNFIHLKFYIPVKLV